VATLLAIELLDELVFGAREAAWPLIRDDLSLSYTEVGLLLAIPSVVSLAVEPLLGLVAVAWQRRVLVLGGGLAFAFALTFAAAADSAWALLVAFSLLYPASGAFVALSQASLMDIEPERRQHNMACWTFAGAVGAIAGPLVLGAAVWLGLDWQSVFVGFAVVALALVVRLRRVPDVRGGVDGERLRVRDALRAMTRREVLRWLFLLELSDLLLDVFGGFLALYLVDEKGTTAGSAGLAVAVWAAAGLLGSAAAIPLLQRVDGLRYLRLSALFSAAVFVAFLLVPGTAAKLGFVAAIALVNAGWYPVLQARLYDALGGASSLVLTVGALFPLNAVLPLAIAMLADQYGLAVALWSVLAAPAALLLLVPRRG
jgi:FSR family fosmidomycin resistance protein-like MFS transporter